VADPLDILVLCVPVTSVAGIFLFASDMRSVPSPCTGEGDLYLLTSLIESKLSKFVLDRLKSTGSDWWEQRVHYPIRKKCAERQEEEKNKITKKEAYLDFMDIKQILRDNWDVFQQPLRLVGFTGSKDKALEWMDRVNELRRMSAHPVKQHVTGFKSSPNDLQFLREVEQRVLQLSLQQFRSCGRRKWPETRNTAIRRRWRLCLTPRDQIAA